MNTKPFLTMLYGKLVLPFRLYRSLLFFFLHVCLIVFDFAKTQRVGKKRVHLPILLCFYSSGSTQKKCTDVCYNPREGQGWCSRWQNLGFSGDLVEAHMNSGREHIDVQRQLYDGLV
eukprot:gb/GEZJ01005858.1/.p1 GENE.gb/GEZJ01005858.1/~~gb/GEZJ01005858.1/.p1  ORF type:complete len:117 (-),score=6.62 gb/GEZJ01005858.1/:40-390(-)